MEVLLFNGSPHEHGCTAAALDEIARTLEEEGIHAVSLWIGRNPIRGCQACGTCTKSPEHHCVFADDIVNTFIDEASRADGIIVGSPVYFSGANGALTTVLDRAFYAGGSVMRYKPAAAVASARRAGTTSTISRLNEYFQFNCMPLVPSTYWPMVHGTAPADVAEDAEGLQIMRNLARSMAWLLQCIDAGEGVGYEKPYLERTAKTNFIR